VPQRFDRIELHCTEWGYTPNTTPTDNEMMNASGTKGNTARQPSNPPSNRASHTP
jgi:hypothetical protein